MLSNRNRLQLYLAKPKLYKNLLDNMIDTTGNASCPFLTVSPGLYSSVRGVSSVCGDLICQGNNEKTEAQTKRSPPAISLGAGLEFIDFQPALGTVCTFDY